MSRRDDPITIGACTTMPIRLTARVWCVSALCYKRPHAIDLARGRAGCWSRTV